MAQRCDICDKSVSFGLSRTYRGMAKKDGGVGIKCTGKTKRKFAPNLQRVRAWINGGVRRVKVCTSCIRSGYIRKPMKRDIPEAVRKRMNEKKSAKA